MLSVHEFSFLGCHVSHLSVLADNPWACVCNAEFLSIDSLVTAFRVQNVTCNSPSTHRGQLVSSLNIAKGRQTNCGEADNAYKYAYICVHGLTQFSPAWYIEHDSVGP